MRCSRALDLEGPAVGEDGDQGTLFLAPSSRFQPTDL
jgi:hypothetical protein